MKLSPQAISGGASFKSDFSADVWMFAHRVGMDTALHTPTL